MSTWKKWRLRGAEINNQISYRQSHHLMRATSRRPSGWWTSSTSRRRTTAPRMPNQKNQTNKKSKMQMPLSSHHQHRNKRKKLWLKGRSQFLSRRMSWIIWTRIKLIRILKCRRQRRQIPRIRSRRDRPLWSSPNTRSHLWHHHLKTIPSIWILQETKTSILRKQRWWTPPLRSKSIRWKWGRLARGISQVWRRPRTKLNP